MGHWRKVTVDDLIPYDVTGKCLLMQTPIPFELWSIIICKATMKIIQLTYDTAYEMPDYGESDLVQLLTGWQPIVYQTMPSFKEQESVLLILEDLQRANDPEIEFEPIEVPKPVVVDEPVNADAKNKGRGDKAKTDTKLPQPPPGSTAAQAPVPPTAGPPPSATPRGPPPGVAGHGGPPPGVMGHGGPPPGVMGHGGPPPGVTGHGGPPPGVMGRGGPPPGVTGGHGAPAGMLM